MWIVPVSTRADAAGGKSTALQRNEVAIMERYLAPASQPASGGLNRLLHEVATIAGEQQPQQTASYRIVLLHPSDPHVIAVAECMADIQRDWDELERDVMTAVRKNNAKDSKAEICDFLLVKFDSYGRIQEGIIAEQRSKAYCRLFGLEGERLVESYKCRIWGEGWGMLYLSPRYLCYQAQEDEAKERLVVVPLSDVNVVQKRKYYGKDNGIAVKTKHGVEYFWASFSVSRGARDAALRVLQRLWEKRMSVVLRSAELGTTHHNPAAGSTLPAALQDAGPGGEHDSRALEEQQKDRTVNRRFRLPKAEQHLRSVACKTWEGSGFKHGMLYVSRHFLCFQTTRGKDVRVTIPFREISALEKENNMLGVKSKGIKVTGKYRRYLYVLETAEGRDAAFAYLVDKWNRSLFECDLMTMQHIPIARNILRIECMLDDNNEFSEDYREDQRRMQALWDVYFKKFGQGMGMAEDRDHLYSLVKQGGIPDTHRGWAWRMFSGANNKANCAPFLGYYQALLAREVSAAVEEEIEKDLHRSFPEHEYYGTEEGIQALRNVLVAYSRHNPSIGYCQSTNIIAALLLVYVSEEWAFWILASICEDLVPENYVQNMLGSIVAQKAFEELLERYLGKVHHHLKELCVPVGVVSHGWFLTFFINYLPLELALRVLDAFFFLQGHMLFAVGLGIFKHFEARLLETTEAEEVTQLLQHELHQSAESTLLKEAFHFVDTLDTTSLAEMQSTQKSEAIRDMKTAAMNSTVRAATRAGTRFTTEELESLYEHFHEVASTRDEYCVDQEQFLAIVANVEGWLRWRKDLARRLFQAADKDNNGYLDFVQFAKGLELVCKGSLREKLEFYWQLHAKDGDEGRLEIAEYYMTLDAVVRAYFEDQVYEADLNALVKWTFEQADVEKCGRVRFADVCCLLLPRGADGTTAQEEAAAQLQLLEHMLKREADP